MSLRRADPPIPVDAWNIDAPVSGSHVYHQGDDYVGGGETFVYTKANSIIGVTMETGHLSVRVQGDEWWNGEFSSPWGALEWGLYDGARRWPYQAPETPGLSVAGEGPGRNTSHGWYGIDAITLAWTAPA